jgi:hypothetical protein
LLRCLLHILIPFPIQKIIEHSEAKDKFLRVSIKRLNEAQNFEDELKWVSAMNETLLVQNQELKTQLAEENQVKAG